MYVVSVTLLLFVLPVASIMIEASLFHGAGAMRMIGKWYVFWAVGIRLLLAGLRQVAQPQFTALEIFDLDSPKAFAMVREIGFGNLAMGTLGICILFRPTWMVPAAVAGGLYYGLAGVGHVFRKDRNAHSVIAMLSDTFAFLVLAAVVVNGLW